MARPAHVCCGVVFLQPQSTVLMAYQPGASGVPAFSPTVSPGCVTEPARAGAAVQSDRTPAAANFVNLLFICNSPIAPRRRSMADRSAESHLVNGNAMSDGDEVEAIVPSHLPTLDFFENCCRNAVTPAPDAWHWSITQIVEHSLAASKNFLPIHVAMWPQRHTADGRQGHDLRGGLENLNTPLCGRT